MPSDETPMATAIVWVENSKVYRRIKDPPVTLGRGRTLRTLYSDDVRGASCTVIIENIEIKAVEIRRFSKLKSCVSDR